MYVYTYQQMCMQSLKSIGYRVVESNFAKESCIMYVCTYGLSLYHLLKDPSSTVSESKALEKWGKHLLIKMFWGPPLLPLPSIVSSQCHLYYRFHFHVRPIRDPSMIERCVCRCCCCCCLSCKHSNECPCLCCCGSDCMVSTFRAGETPCGWCHCAAV